MQYIDLTHKFTAQMPVYPGDSKPELVELDSVEEKGFSHYEIKTGMHVGTHMDAPAHMLQGGKLLSEFDASRFIGRGHLADARGHASITTKSLIGLDINEGDIVLVMTGWYKKFKDNDYFAKYPEITEEFAKEMVNLGVSIVGLDTPSPDTAPFNIHKLLLGKEILIIENLTNLEELLYHKNFEVYALPAKFESEAAPCRVVARV